MRTSHQRPCLPPPHVTCSSHGASPRAGATDTEAVTKERWKESPNRVHKQNRRDAWAALWATGRAGAARSGARGEPGYSLVTGVLQTRGLHRSTLWGSHTVPHTPGTFQSGTTIRRLSLPCSGPRGSGRGLIRAPRAPARRGPRGRARAGVWVCGGPCSKLHGYQRRLGGSSAAARRRALPAVRHAPTAATPHRRGKSRPEKAVAAGDPNWGSPLGRSLGLGRPSARSREARGERLAGRVATKSEAQRERGSR